jgi:gluconate kinase
MVARLIEMITGDGGWLTHYTNDYEHLQKMFLQEKAECTPLERRNLRLTGPEECNGFDVINFSVLSKVLEILRREVEEVESESSEEDNILFLIEFARDSYHDALQLFGSNLLQDAHLLYLDVDLESCIERNHQRSDHFVSDEIMKTYYREDDWSRVMYNLQYNWDKCVIRNSSTLQDLKQEVEEWVDAHLKREVTVIVR